MFLPTTLCRDKKTNLQLILFNSEEVKNVTFIEQWGLYEKDRAEYSPDITFVINREKCAFLHPACR